MSAPKFLVVALALVAICTVLGGDPSCNQYKSGGRVVLSVSKAKKLFKRDYERIRASENGAKTLMRMIDDGDLGGGYYGGGPVATDVSQLSKKYITQIDVGPLTSTKPEPTLFQSTEGKAAMSCQLDCMSQVGGRPAFQGCTKRFYKYGSLQTQGCFTLNIIGDEQAALVLDVCQKYNGCYGPLAVFTKEGLKTANGQNTFYTPPSAAASTVTGSSGSKSYKKKMIYEDYY